MSSSKDILEWTGSMTLLLSSGLNVQEAVSLTRSLQSGSSLSVPLSRIEDKITKGLPLSQCLRDEKKFSSLFTELIVIGEKVGDLSLVFRQLTIYLEDSRKIRDKIHSALIYPALLLILISAGTGALVFWFIPRLQESLSFNAEIAEDLARSLSTGKTVLLMYLLFLAGLLVLVLFSRIFLRPSSPLTVLFHRLSLSLPLLGAVLVKRDMYNLFFSLSLLTHCRIPLEESLSLSLLVLENSYLKERIYRLRQSLLKGEALSRLFGREKVFPKIISQWIGVGERIGKMSEVFLQLETYYKQEMEKITERIMTLVEPVTSLLIGVVLLVVVITLIVPLITVYGGLI
ncbi:MAG: type II secretion system F family protein [Spirochaetales bacterium]|nr:type II secretion system F family protein [Spirochaetales bacterium]